MSKVSRLQARREKKFDRYAVQIKEEEVTEERKDRIIKFKFAVYAGKHLIGRATKKRYALKKGHQYVRDAAHSTR